MLKNSRFVKYILLLALPLIIYNSQLEAVSCVGRFPNPVTDVCWTCVFPISVGPSTFSANQADPNSDLPMPLICQCPIVPPPFIRYGVGITYWEPIRIAETVRTPYCFPFLDGAIIGPTNQNIGETHTTHSGNEKKQSFYHMHWFQAPILSWVGSSMSSICGQSDTFDLAYISEIDPTWNNDELSFMLNPEAVLFGNPVAQIACVADAVTANVTGFGIDSLFWCSGSQGSVYPFTGNVSMPNGGIDASLAMVHRHLAKMHRSLQLMETSQPPVYPLYCAANGNPMPILRKSLYKQQMLFPVPNNLMGLGFGATSSTWGSGHEIPTVGEDFNYLIWRKRSCCAL